MQAGRLGCPTRQPRRAARLERRRLPDHRLRAQVRRWTTGRLTRPPLCAARPDHSCLPRPLPPHVDLCNEAGAPPFAQAASSVRRSTSGRCRGSLCVRRGRAPPADAILRTPGRVVFALACAARRHPCARLRPTAMTRRLSNHDAKLAATRLAGELIRGCQRKWTTDGCVPLARQSAREGRESGHV